MNSRKPKDQKGAFGRTIRRLRLSKGLSQEELAELASIHRTYVGDVERGVRNISIVNMSRLAQALGLPLSRVIKEMEDTQ